MKKTALMMLVALAVVGVAQADRTVDETRPLAADGRVVVSNISGMVKVAGWTGDGVNITGTLEDGVSELDISSGGSRLTIEVELERRSRRGSAYLTIKVPTNANLEIETVSADISVDGVAGELELESVSGHVEVSGEPRSLEAASVSGNVIAASTALSSDLESVSGNIIVRNTASGNTLNWDVAANNACLVVYRTGCTAISGNSGGSAPGSTDPNANFTY